MNALVRYFASYSTTKSTQPSTAHCDFGEVMHPESLRNVFESYKHFKYKEIQHKYDSFFLNPFVSVIILTFFLNAYF